MNTTRATGVIIMYNDDIDKELGHPKSEILIVRVELPDDKCSLADRHRALLRIRDELRGTREYDHVSLETWLDGAVPIKRYPETP